MSRTHERAYRLLAERVRLGVAARRSFYLAIAALVGSGIWWLLAHYVDGGWFVPGDDRSRIAQQTLALKVHGATAFAILFALGALSAQHVRRAWALRHNRWLGSFVVVAFAILTLSGYALYYLVSDDTHATISLVHWATGLALAPLIATHIIMGRRNRAKRQMLAGR
jgi:hypothetical protein